MPTTYGQSIQNEAPTFSNSLELVETADVVDNFVFGWCGLIKVQRNVKDFELKRISKPTFTYEFAYNLGRLIFRESNRITGRTTYTEKMLNRYNLKRAEVIRGTLQHEGFPNMITEEVWRIILKLGELDTSTETDLKQAVTFWKSKYGINWNYDMPVNTDMLNIIKRDYKLEEIDFGQHAVMRQVYLDINLFLDGSLNRSLNGLTLNYEKVIHKESYVENTDSQPTRKEGIIDNAKTTMRNIVGNNNQNTR